MRRAKHESVRPSEYSATIVERIQAEYVEMPGLSLTLTQAARFWGVSPVALEQQLSSLVKIGFLQCDKNGCYRRCR